MLGRSQILRPMYVTWTPRLPGHTTIYWKFYLYVLFPWVACKYVQAYGTRTSVVHAIGVWEWPKCWGQRTPRKPLGHQATSLSNISTTHFVFYRTHQSLSDSQNDVHDYIRNFEILIQKKTRHLFIFRGQSTMEPRPTLNLTTSRVTQFILRAHTGTGVSHSQHRKHSGEVFGKQNAGKWTGRVKISKEKLGRDFFEKWRWMDRECRNYRGRNCWQLA